MRAIIGVAACVAATGCAVEKISPPGVVLTRPVVVLPRDVKVFAAIADVPARYAFVDDIWIKDDGDMSPSEMESRLRVQAGARGANAIVLGFVEVQDSNIGRVLIQAP